jgi:hypothetical protein
MIRGTSKNKFDELNHLLGCNSPYNEFQTGREITGTRDAPPSDGARCLPGAYEQSSSSRRTRTQVTQPLSTAIYSFDVNKVRVLLHVRI